ncbi:hypothetical protein ACJIZ3_011836 [Penstemon smallii]|uniref:Uncharacterized protein n=1 Tax=Penstemon smallii TaxID=265156 RepID=A0ABD3UK96_9LAMI
MLKNSLKTFIVSSIRLTGTPWLITCIYNIK